jgi:hypothetical protein
MKLLSLKEYLSSPLQLKQHFFSRNNNIGFHWADFNETCQIYMQYLKKNKLGVRDKLLDQVNHFKATDVWIKADNRVVTLNLYQIYDCLVAARPIPIIEKGKEDYVELSFMGPGGLFRKMTLGHCFNEDSYSQFVFHRLLNGDLPMRDFRLRIHGKILCYYDQIFKRSCTIEVSQITSEGLLFVSHEKNLQNKIKHASSFRPLIDLSLFRKALGHSMVDMANMFSNANEDLLFTQDDRCEYQIDPRDLKFYKGYDSEAKGVDYIFCRFEDIKGNNDLLEEILKSFTEYLKKQIMEETAKAAA